MSAVIGKSMLPDDQKHEVMKVWTEFLDSLIELSNIKSGQMELLEELSETFFESFRDYKGKFNSLA